jgi:arylsulfatase A-like enzyme
MDRLRSGAIPGLHRMRVHPSWFGMIRIPGTLIALACWIGFPGIALPQTAATGTRPNLILIMSDDMGYSDLGCYGAEISTPHLDRLAAGGLRYTRFYNAGRCCPTRASLLTGLYPHQAGIGQMTSDSGQPGYRGDLSKDAVTLAEVLKSAGYRTYMSGKWHVARNLDHGGDKSNWPLQRGFDRFYGTIIGAGSFYDPWTLTRGNEAITPDNDAEYQPEQFYYTDAISDHAVRFVNEHAAGGEEAPFFLYVSHTAPHWPMHALEKDIAKYKGRYDAGYGPIREARFQRMKELGVIDGAGLSPAPRSWEDIPEDQRAWETRCMEVYAAMIDCMDQGIGRLVEALGKNGQLDDTLILYLQDNGGCAETYGRTPRENPAEGVEPMGRDELQTSMIPLRTRSGQPVLMGPGVMPGPATSYIAYGGNWANVSNTPFREYKARNHEGGIATPMIAHWPKGITARGGLRHEAGHLIDFMATAVELARAGYPAEVAGRQVPPMEGRSLVPGFAKDRNEERLLIWEHYRNAAILKGKWKLVRLNTGKSGSDMTAGWELYDIENDRSELHNLAGKHPETAARLQALWTEHAHRTLIHPMPDKK